MHIHRYFGIWDISVAFFHAVLDEVIYLHPRCKALCPPGWCWRLLKAMNGTRKASTLYGSTVVGAK